MKLSEYLNDRFAFLNKYGYVILDKGNESVICYRGQYNEVDILYSGYTYELFCEFVDNNTQKSFSLQDGLDYSKIGEFKGTYQLSGDQDIEKAVRYIAEAVERLYAVFDISNLANFDAVYNFTVSNRKKALNEYYLRKELNKADYYWSIQEYGQAAQLYEKNLTYLSQAQRKKLDYIREMGIS